MPAFIHVLGPMLASTNPRTLLMTQESGGFRFSLVLCECGGGRSFSIPIYRHIRHSPIWERAETASEQFETGLGVKKNCGRADFPALSHPLAVKPRTKSEAGRYLQKKARVCISLIRQANGAVFGHIAATGSRVAELAALARITKQSVSYLVESLAPRATSRSRRTPRMGAPNASGSSGEAARYGIPWGS
jgi:hypothetical protein